MSNDRQSSDNYGAEDLSESIARLRRAMRRAARYTDPKNPLSVAQLELLTTLMEHPGIRPGQLAQLMHMQPNTATTIINALRDKGMVKSSTVSTDRRAIELSVTDAGKQAVYKWQTVNAAIFEVTLTALSASQRRTLIAAIPSLYAIAAAIDMLTEGNQ
jgi:DNA-binding MarR family transcriptional regulator